MARGQRRIFGGACCLVFLLASTARAESVCPQSSSPEQARRLAGQTFTQAEARFAAGDHQGAIELFECSFSLVPHPSTLYNIARTAEEIGDLPLALITYRSYLDRFVDAERRAEVEQSVQRLERELEQGTPDSSPSPDPSTDEPPGPAAHADLDAEPNQEEPNEAPVSRPDEALVDQSEEHLDPVETRMSTPRILAWILLPLGLSAGAVGGGLYGAAVRRNHDYRDAEADGEPQEVLDELIDAGQSFERAAWSLIGVGSAFLVTSLVLFVAFDSETTVGVVERRRGQLMPLLGLSCMGVIGTF